MEQIIQILELANSSPKAPYVLGFLFVVFTLSFIFLLREFFSWLFRTQKILDEVRALRAELAVLHAIVEEGNKNLQAPVVSKPFPSPETQKIVASMSSMDVKSGRVEDKSFFSANKEKPSRGFPLSY